MLTLVPQGSASAGALRISLGEGKELLVTALFVDLRNSTVMAAGRFPYDVIHIIDRYIQIVTGVIRAYGGYVTHVAGDGIMSVFGASGDAKLAAQGALASVYAVLNSLENLRRELESEMGMPLNVGIGVHSGLSVLGDIALSETLSIQFLGETGNIAARLEGLTKEHSCKAIVSEAVFVTAGFPETASFGTRQELTIRGQDEIIPAVLISQKEPLQVVFEAASAAILPAGRNSRKATLQPVTGNQIYVGPAVAIATAGLFVSQFYGQPLEPSPARPAGMAITVSRTENRCFADELNASGFLVPAKEVQVWPGSEGVFRVAEIMIEDGQQVERGQILARLVHADETKGKLPDVQLLSPAAGKAVIKAARMGALVAATGEPLFYIVAEGKLAAEAEVPASDLQKIAAGQQARVAVPGNGEVEGRVETKSAWVDPVTQMGHVRLSLQPKGGMLPGTSANLRIRAGESCGVTVPSQAILYGRGGAYLFVVSGNKVETRRVQVGVISGDTAQVRHGVRENEVVVARAGAFLTDGDIVRPAFGDGAKQDKAQRASR